MSSSRQKFKFSSKALLKHFRNRSIDSSNRIDSTPRKSKRLRISKTKQHESAQGEYNNNIKIEGSRYPESTKSMQKGSKQNSPKYAKTGGGSRHRKLKNTTKIRESNSQKMSTNIEVNQATMKVEENTNNYAQAEDQDVVKKSHTKNRKLLLQKQIETNTKLARKQGLVKRKREYTDDARSANTTVNLPNAIRKASNAQAFSVKAKSKKWDSGVSGYNTYSNYNNLGVNSRPKFINKSSPGREQQSEKSSKIEAQFQKTKAKHSSSGGGVDLFNQYNPLVYRKAK